MADVFAAWLKHVDQPAKGDDFIEPIIKALAEGDVFGPGDLVGLAASEFTIALASPGKRAFLSRAIERANKEFGATVQLSVCVLCTGV